MSRFDAQADIIELIYTTDDGYLQRVSARVEPSARMTAYLMADLELTGYRAGDLVSFNQAPDHPYPVITGRLFRPAGSNIVPIRAAT